MTLIKKADIVLVIVLVMLAVLFLFLFKPYNKVGNTVVISVNGDVYKTIPLDVNRTIDITAKNNETINTIMVEDGTVYMSYADCDDKLCVHQGKISSSNQLIVCLPNKVLVEIRDNKNESELDAISQ